MKVVLHHVECKEEQGGRGESTRILNLEERSLGGIQQKQDGWGRRRKSAQRSHLLIVASIVRLLQCKCFVSTKGEQQRQPWRWLW